jgi:hypothetical protein
VTTYDKRAALQALLDTSKVCTDLFDEVEADTFEVTQPLLQRLKLLADTLTALHQQMVLEYVLHGRAADDFLQQIRDDLLKEQEEGEGVA